MQAQLFEVGEKLLQVEEKWHHVIEESEVLKEQLTFAQDQNNHLAHAVSYRSITTTGYGY